MKKRHAMFILAAIFGTTAQARAMGRIPKEEYLKKVQELERTQAELEQARKQCQLDQENLQAKMESQVNEQGKQVLKRVSDVLKKVKGKQIRIEGHTDNVPVGGSLKEIYPTNWELSTARATAVARYLQEAGGVDPQLLTAAGYGEY